MHSLLLSNPFLHTEYQTIKANIYEKDDAYLIELEVPGFAKDGVAITATNNSLTIKAKRSVAIPEGFKTYRQEFQDNSLQRTFRFRGNINADAVQAKNVNGILSITLPKDEVRLIEIQTS